MTDTPAPETLDDLQLEVAWDGQTEHINLGELTAEEAGLFRRNVGMSLRAAMEDLDVDAVAGLVWISRRRRQPKLLYTQVARSFTYQDMLSIVTPEDEPGEDGDPEA